MPNDLAMAALRKKKNGSIFIFGVLQPPEKVICQMRLEYYALIEEEENSKGRRQGLWMMCVVYRCPLWPTEQHVPFMLSLVKK